MPTPEPQRGSERAYRLALRINPARRRPTTGCTPDGALDYASADHWLTTGLALPALQPHERSLLLNSACELRFTSVVR